MPTKYSNLLPNWITVWLFSHGSHCYQADHKCLIQISNSCQQSHREITNIFFKAPVAFWKGCKKEQGTQLDWIFDCWWDLLTFGESWSQNWYFQLDYVQQITISFFFLSVYTKLPPSEWVSVHLYIQSTDRSVQICASILFVCMSIVFMLCSMQ